MRHPLWVWPSLILPLCLIVFAAPAWSAARSSVFFEERTSLLPIGRSLMGFKTDLRRSSEWIGSDGHRSVLGEKFSEKIVTDEGVVERTYRIKARLNQFTPYWGYGLTSSWSLFAAIPIHHVQSCAQISYRGEAQNLTGNKAASFFVNRDESPFQAPRSDDSDVLIGHVFFLSQIRLIERPEGRLAFQQRLRVPTGEHDDLAYFMNGSPEASGYGLELGLLADFHGPMRTQLLTHLKGTVNFSDEVYAREHGSSHFFKVQRDPGETIEARAGVEKRVVSHFHVGTDYFFVKTLPDAVPENVEIFKENTDMHLVRGSLAYRPPEFLRLRSFDDYNYSGRVTYSQVVGGKNVPEYQAVGVELSVAY